MSKIKNSDLTDFLVILVIIMVSLTALYIKRHTSEGAPPTYKEVIETKHAAERSLEKGYLRRAARLYVKVADRCEDMAVLMDTCNQPVANSLEMGDIAATELSQRFHTFYEEAAAYRDMEAYALNCAAKCYKKLHYDKKAVRLATRALSIIDKSQEDEWKTAVEIISEITGTGFEDYPETDDGR